MKVLLDLNVCLDFYFGDRTKHDLAVELFDILIKQNIDIMIAASSLNNFFYLSDKKIKSMQSKNASSTKKTEAWALLDSLCNLVSIVGMDMSDVFVAQKLKNLHNDFEDNQILAAAMRSNADYLISNDENLIKHANVPCLSVEDFINFLP